jgi:F-type H+-transporting ATPase subunit a
VPSGTPLAIKFFIAPIEFVSFLVRPFSLGLRPFVAMFAGHILLEVFGNFVVQGLNAGVDGSPMGWAIAALCFVFVIGVNALELLVGAIQAFVFALLTALYIKDAVHLH